MTFPVPDSYVADLDPGERADWLATLPDLAGRYADRWALRPDGAPLHGNVGVVWPVRRADDTPAMLKLSWPHPEAQDEGVALAAWAGRGTVRLLEHDDTDYALLLERLDPHHSLDEEPIDTAVEIAGGLLRTLSIPAPPLRRTVTAQAEDWLERLPKEAADLGHPIPPTMLATVLDHCRRLGPTAGHLMVNEDLHYLNVLRGSRAPWLLIDPKPIVGDPEFGIIPMLWNRYDETGGAQGVPARFDAIVRAAGLDREPARAWTLVRAVANWLWALPDDFADVMAGIAAAMVD